MKTGRFTDVEKMRKTLSPRALLIAGVLCWSALVLLFTVSSVVSGESFLAVVGASWIAQVFAGAALFVALRGESGAERQPWMLFGGAVAARLVADVVWVGSRAFGLGLAEAFQVVAHAVSYVLFFGVLLWVMARIRQEEFSVAALDTLAVVLTSGLLIRFFAPFPFDELPLAMTLAVLIRPVCDLGLLFLGLAALMTVRRPRFVVISVVGLLLLLIADGAFLWSRAQGLYVLGFAEVFWSGGVMLLGFAVLYWGGEPVERSDHVGNFGVGLFWFGPFSPLLHYGILLLWAAVYGPVPAYLLIGGVALVAILSVRNYAAAYAGSVMARRQEALALQAEQGRILRGLHDTVKQDIHGTSMMIEAAVAAQKGGATRRPRVRSWRGRWRPPVRRDGSFRGRWTSFGRQPGTMPRTRRLSSASGSGSSRAFTVCIRTRTLRLRGRSWGGRRSWLRSRCSWRRPGTRRSTLARRTSGSLRAGRVTGSLWRCATMGAATRRGKRRRAWV